MIESTKSFMSEWFINSIPQQINADFQFYVNIVYYYNLLSCIMHISNIKFQQRT